MSGVLRIALLTGEPPDAAGGVGDYTLRLAEAMQSAGHEVSIAPPGRLRSAHSGDGSARAWPRATSTAERSTGPLTPDVVLFQYVPYLYSRWGLPLGVLATVSRLAQGHSPVVLVAHEPFNFGARALRHRAVAALQRALFRELARRCAAVVVTTQMRRRSVEAVVRPATPVRVIPVGATLPGLDTPFRSADRAPGPFRILVFGRLELRRRRPDVVLAAAATLSRADSPIALDLVGPTDGATEAWRRNLTAEAGIRVAFAGHVEPAEAASAFVRADATVVFDTLGLGGVSTRSTVAANALAAGVPIVANGGADTDSLYVDGECILLCEPRVADLALRLESLRTSATLRERLARNGRRLYDERLAWRVIAEHYEALAAELAAGGRRRGQC